MSDSEAILDPELPIIDPHHHLWDRPTEILKNLPPLQHPFMDIIHEVPRYLLDELLADLRCGHDVRATVYLECGAMYRADGPPELSCVGETEFVNGIAAMTASGLYGNVRACAAIVGHVDLTMGARVEEVLRAHIAAAPARFRGIRQSASYDEDFNVLGPLAGRAPQGLYLDSRFREGFACLERLGLSFDAWMLEPQLPDLIDLARAFPQTTIVLDHVGTPLGIGAYQGRREERFDVWRRSIRELASCPNVVVKLGGLAMPFAAFPWSYAKPAQSSEQLAQAWKPYIETCIEAFGPTRAMFESNYPVDSYTGSYRLLWNAFKRIAAGCSVAEKRELFSGTASRVYRVQI
ncbi:MAG TPA: amidohydrolase family protein [Candidatus Limnocylindrales bacterium]|nr:amidohydrolase family protein [Candidatus Limnocylindrales bacterium]